MVFGFDDAVVIVGAVLLWNRYMPWAKKTFNETTGWDVPAPDNLVTNTVTKSVKDGLVEGFFEIFNGLVEVFFEIFNCYMSFPWWWHATTALIFGFIYFSCFEKQFWDLIRIAKYILRNCMVICGWAVHGTMEIVQSMTGANTAAPAPAKKARAKSPAPAKSPARKESGIKVGKSVKSKHAEHGNVQYEAEVVSIIGVWCVIKWKDNDTTDTVKHVDELTLIGEAD
jgi:hypothetical protein